MSVCSSFLILQRKEWKLGEVKALRLAGCLGNGSKSDIQCSQLGVWRPQAGFAGTIVLLKATAVRDRGQWCVQLQSISPLLQRGQRTSPGMTPCQEGLLRSEWNPSRPAPLRSDIGMVGWVSVGSQARPQREAWQSKNMPFRPSGRCELHHCIFLSSLCPLGIKNLNIGIVSQS